MTTIGQYQKAQTLIFMRYRTGIPTTFGAMPYAISEWSE
jgi:hypothetical protein